MKVAVRAAVLMLFILSFAPVTRGQAGVQVPTGFPNAGEQARITMVSGGAEPRKPLRYAVAKDYKGHMNMDMAMSMAMNMGGQSMPMDLPTMRIGADMSVTDVSTAGDITYSLSFTGMEVVNAPDPSMAAALAPFSDDVKKITGTVTVTSRGVTRTSKIDASKVSNPMFTQTMDSVTNSLNNISMPFPEEAVGIGAKWEVRQSIASGGLTQFQKVLCELTAYDGKSATLKMALESTAPPQAMSNPALPAGMDMRLDSLSGSGTGTMTTFLDALIPASEMTMKSDMSMSVSGQSMSVGTTLKMQVSSVKK